MGGITIEDGHFAGGYEDVGGMWRGRVVSNCGCGWQLYGGMEMEMYRSYPEVACVPGQVQ